ncbi:hypothetical protein A9P82_13105 [Arachidicoccus ginsenosidimutans]|nr:hypothetical protein A9P82_13105 [Arachidicoccus sp. BS20]
MQQNLIKESFSSVYFLLFFNGQMELLRRTPFRQIIITLDMQSSYGSFHTYIFYFKQYSIL